MKYLLFVILALLQGILCSWIRVSWWQMAVVEVSFTFLLGIYWILFEEGTK